MPFAENARRVTGEAKQLRQREGFQIHAFALVDGVCHAVLEFVAAGHQGRSGRGTGRADVKIGEADAARVQLVDVRRLQDRIAVAGEIAVALVIGDDENDVGFRSLELLGRCRRWGQNRCDRCQQDPGNNAGVSHRPPSF